MQRFRLSGRRTEGKYAGVIGVGGLLLAKVPEEIAEATSRLYD